MGVLQSITVELDVLFMCEHEQGIIVFSPAAPVLFLELFMLKILDSFGKSIMKSVKSRAAFLIHRQRPHLLK